MKPIALATWATGTFGLALLGCRTAPAPTEDVQPSGVVSEASARPEAGIGGRPVVLDYRDERQRLALLGLSYGPAGVSVDAAQAALRVEGPDPVRAEQAFDQGLAEIRGNAILAGLDAHTRAVLLNPDDGRMYEGLGDALRVARLESRAEAAYRTALDLEPSADRFVKLAEILWMRAASEAAIEQALQAIAADPDHGRAITDLARWFYFTGSYAQAWDFVHRAEALGAPLPSQFRPLLASRMPEPNASGR